MQPDEKMLVDQHFFTPAEAQPTSLHILPCSPVCFVKSFLPSILDAISFASSGLFKTI